MKKLKSMGTSIIGSIIIVLVYWFVNSLGVDNSYETDRNQLVLETLLEEVREDKPKGEFLYMEGIVERVVDGDTIVVFTEGESVKVRLAGIDTPESVGEYKDKPQVYGKEASAYTKALLDGEKVYLELDDKAYDKYDRLLAYVWLKPPTLGGLAWDCVNGRLIKEGYATWFDDHDNTKYAEAFEAYEKSAKKKTLGLWAR